MITIFGGTNPSFEEVGNMELFRMSGSDVTYVVPDYSPENTAPLYSARALLAPIGVSVVPFSSEVVEKAKHLISFGRVSIFDALSTTSSRPHKVWFSPSNNAPLEAEINALSAGLFDTLLCKNSKQSFSYVKQLLEGAKTGIDHLLGYKPFCNPASPVTKLLFTPSSKSNENFVTLVDPSGPGQRLRPDLWRILTMVSSPQQNKEFVVAACEEEVFPVAKDISNDEHPFAKVLFPKLKSDRLLVSDLEEVYGVAHVLLNFNIGPETFAFSVAKAFLSGSAVVAGPNAACRELVEHEKTGLLAESADEAAYLVSKLAWEPRLREKLSLAAYNYMVEEGPGNADRCLRWWKEHGLWD